MQSKYDETAIEFFEAHRRSLDAMLSQEWITPPMLINTRNGRLVVPCEVLDHVHALRLVWDQHEDREYAAELKQFVIELLRLPSEPHAKASD